MFSKFPCYCHVCGEFWKVKFSSFINSVEKHRFPAAKHNADIAAYNSNALHKGMHLTIVTIVRTIARTGIIFYHRHYSIGGQSRKRLHITASISKPPYSIRLRRHQVIYRLRVYQTFKSTMRPHLAVAFDRRTHQITIVSTQQFFSTDNLPRLAHEMNNVISRQLRIEIKIRCTPGSRSRIGRIPFCRRRNVRIVPFRMVLLQIFCKSTLSHRRKVGKTSIRRKPAYPFSIMSGIDTITNNAIGIGRRFKILYPP